MDFNFMKQESQNPDTAAGKEDAGSQQADQTGEQVNADQHEEERRFAETSCKRARKAFQGLSGREAAKRTRREGA